MENDNLENRTSEEAFDTTGLLLAFLANWKWFVLSVFVCLVVAWFYIARQVPVYQVNASIYLSQDNSSQRNAFNVGQSTDPMVALKNYIDETELEVLKSKNNVIKIVDSLNLAYSYYKEGTFRDIPLYENNAIEASLDSASLRNLREPIQIDVSRNDDDTYRVKVATTYNGVEEKKDFDSAAMPLDIELSHGTLTLKKSPVTAPLESKEKIVIVSPRARAAQLSGSLNIEFAKNSDKIIRISYNTTVVKEGIDVINALLEFYNREIIEDKNRSAIQTEAFILDRLVMISGELRDVENRLQAYRQAHNITNIEAQTGLNLNLKSDYEKQMAENDAELQHHRRNRAHRFVGRHLRDSPRRYQQHNRQPNHRGLQPQGQPAQPYTRRLYPRQSSGAHHAGRAQPRQGANPPEPRHNKAQHHGAPVGHTEPRKPLRRPARIDAHRRQGLAGNFPRAIGEGQHLHLPSPAP